MIFAVADMSFRFINNDKNEKNIDQQNISQRPKNYTEAKASFNYHKKSSAIT